MNVVNPLLLLLMLSDFLGSNNTRKLIDFIAVSILLIHQMLLESSDSMLHFFSIHLVLINRATFGAEARRYGLLVISRHLPTVIYLADALFGHEVFVATDVRYSTLC